MSPDTRIYTAKEFQELMDAHAREKADLVRELTLRYQAEQQGGFRTLGDTKGLRFPESKSAVDT